MKHGHFQYRLRIRKYLQTLENEVRTVRDPEKWVENYYDDYGK